VRKAIWAGLSVIVVAALVVRASMPEVLAPLCPEAYGLRWSVLDLREVVPNEGSESSLALIG
jgi:hypothetical protein